MTALDSKIAVSKLKDFMCHSITTFHNITSEISIAKEITVRRVKKIYVKDSNKFLLLKIFLYF